MPASIRKPPQQDRSRKVENALLRAGVRAVGTRGVAALNMAELAAEAGASIGSLYFRFGDKSQFVGAVLAIALEEFHDRGFAMCETAEREKWPKRRVLEGWVVNVIASARERRTLIRELISHMATQPEAWKPIHERRRELEDRLLTVLSARPGDGFKPAQKLRLRIGLQVVAATVVHMVIVDPGPLRIDDPSLKNVLCDLLYSFIDAPAGNAKKNRQTRKSFRPEES